MSTDRSNLLEKISFTGLSRRFFVVATGGLAAGLALDGSPLAALLRATGQPALKIGIIGSGNQGGALGLLWARAGHQILFSSRHPEELTGLVDRSGSRARAGLPAEAATFGEVVLIAVPYGALPQVGRDYGPLMQGKVVIDCGNPYENRDGIMALEALEKGTGVASAEFVPGVRLVRAFNAIGYRSLSAEAHRAGEKVAIPIAGDDEAAVAVIVGLVEDAGFDPVVVGDLSSAREFDNGTAVYTADLTATQLREALNIPWPPPAFGAHETSVTRR